MKRLLKQWFSPSATASEEISLEQATALLLVEAAKADYNMDANEQTALIAALQQGLGISAQAATELLAWATKCSAESASLHPFTRVINQHLSPEDKTELMTNLWRVAFADGRIDKYEEYYLRHIADLLYLPHSMFIDAKLRSMANSSDHN